MAAFFRPSNPSPSAAMFHNQIVDEEFATSDVESLVFDIDYQCDLDFEEEEDCDLAVFMAPVSTITSRKSRRQSFVSIANRCNDYSPSWLQERPRCPTPTRASGKVQAAPVRCRNPTPSCAGRLSKPKRSTKYVKAVVSIEITTRAVSCASSSGCSSLATSPAHSPVRQCCLLDDFAAANQRLIVV